MSDSYQAIYDATRSRINPVNTYEVLERAAAQAFDMGNARALLQEAIGMIGNEMVRPSAIYRPAISIDGNQWCALYGENLQDGVAGFGDTPEAAMAAFDKAWHEKMPQRAAP
jgi:hypothetical protein